MKAGFPSNDGLLGAQEVKVRNEPYSLLHGGPRRYGDEDEILIVETDRVVRVMLLQGDDGKDYLVQVRPAKKLA